jgi:hypothetical protein
VQVVWAHTSTPRLSSRAAERGGAGLSSADTAETLLFLGGIMYCYWGGLRLMLSVWLPLRGRSWGGAHESMSGSLSGSALTRDISTR